LGKINKEQVMKTKRWVRHNQKGQPCWKGLTLTDWFPSHIKPVRNGLYIIGSDSLAVMSTWNGKEWIRGNGTPLPSQDICWRGVDYEI